MHEITTVISHHNVNLAVHKLLVLVWKKRYSEHTLVGTTAAIVFTFIMDLSPFEFSRADDSITQTDTSVEKKTTKHFIL